LGENTITLNLDYQDKRKELLVSATGTALPTLAAGRAGVINATSVRLFGEITNAGVPAYTERGFVYSTTANPTLENGTKITVANSSENKFSTDVTNLTSNRTYHARTYVISVLGTFYSTNASFTPSAEYDYITVSTQSASLTAHTHDIGGKHDWQTAKSMCENSVVGGFNNWRLPSRDELLFLYQHRYDFGNFVIGNTSEATYWTGELASDVRYWVRHFGNYGETASASVGSGFVSRTELHNVRCVRPMD